MHRLESSTTKWLLPAAFCTMCFVSGAQTVDISNAAYSGVFEWDCRSAAAIAQGSSRPDLCEAGSGVMPRRAEVVQQTVLGGFNAATHATRGLAISGGDVSGSAVDASDVDQGVRVRAGAFSGTPYSRVSVQSEALQSFLYTGPAGQQRSVRNTLDFMASVAPLADFGPLGSGVDPTAPATFVGAWLMVFSLAAPSFSFNASQGIGASQFMTAASVRADFRMEGDSQQFPLLSSGVGSVVSFIPEVGRYYFIETYLGVWSRFGAQIDARHTMVATLGYGDAQSFVASGDGFVAAQPLAQPWVIQQSVGSVPEPSARAMLAVALSAMVVWLRSKRTSARPQEKSASSTTL